MWRVLWCGFVRAYLPVRLPVCLTCTCGSVKSKRCRKRNGRGLSHAVRQTDCQTDRQTVRQTDNQAVRQTVSHAGSRPCPLCDVCFPPPDIHAGQPRIQPLKLQAVRSSLVHMHSRGTRASSQSLQVQAGWCHVSPCVHAKGWVSRTRYGLVLSVWLCVVSCPQEVVGYMSHPFIPQKSESIAYVGTPRPITSMPCTSTPHRA
mmetsp:Transcript_21964/g.62550  ORF Transcript_21964/g.62550 Transcript_21964/m.62550 type:complete len:203 (-) Transcript_21964:137-745(-)